MVDQIQGWAVIGTLRAISRLWGKGASKKIRENIDGEFGEIFKNDLQAAAALPINAVLEILEQVEREHGDGSGRSLRKLGRETGKLAVDVVFTIYKAVGDFDRALKSLPSAWKKIHSNVNKDTQITPSVGGSNVFLLSAHLEGVEIWAPFCEGWIQGYLEGVVGEHHVINVTSQNMDDTIEFHITHSTQEG